MSAIAENYVQDQNAGNLGDLLKHYWLLKLVDTVLEKTKTRSIAYFESHAGAGRYLIDKKRIDQISKGKALLASRAEHNLDWGKFDRLNSAIQRGVYFGSFPLILQRLAEWRGEDPKRMVKAMLWESHQTAQNRIEEFQSEVIPASLSREIEIKAISSPAAFVDVIKKQRSEADVIFWLCDPYWGKTNEKDRAWWILLSELRETYGILFGFVGGNSFKRGDEKFDFGKVIGAPAKTPPRQYWIPDSVRAYGLFLTEAAEQVLKFEN